jgi:hypothetical protein
MVVRVHQFRPFVLNCQFEIASAAYFNLGNCGCYNARYDPDARVHVTTTQARRAVAITTES